MRAARPPASGDGPEPALSPWTGEFVDRAHEEAARRYLGAATGRQYSQLQLLASLLVLGLWAFDVAALGLGPTAFALLAARLTLLVVWAVDRPRIAADPRLGIDGAGMTVGQLLAGGTVVLAAWCYPVVTHQLDAFIMAIAVLMLFANQAVRRLVISAGVLVAVDLIFLLRGARADLLRVAVDHAAGWVFGAACSVTLNAFRRRNYLHWLAERESRARLDEEMARRHEVEQELTRLAERDDLTGLPNRRVFLAEAAAALADGRERHRPVCLLIIDADHFKRINDTWGHHVGDDVLRHITEGLRDLDRSGHAVGRLGGEEFGVVVKAGEARAADVAEQLRVRVAQDWLVVDGEVLQVTMSVGVARAGLGDDVAAVLRRADEALYLAKHAGRDRVCVAG